MKKNKFLILLFLVAILSLSIGHIALALELRYPSLPGAPTITQDTKLKEYLQYWFIFAYMAAGIVAVISIVFSGFQILIYAGNPTVRSDAMDRIREVVLGIALLLLSFILLRTINPDLVSPLGLDARIAPNLYTVRLSTVGGYKYEKAPEYVSNTSSPIEFDPAITKLFYYCDQPGPQIQHILVWVYSKEDFEIDRTKNNNNASNVKTYDLACDTVMTPLSSIEMKDQNAPILSYFWDYKESGVYYFLNNNCTGIMSCYNNDSCAQKSNGDLPYFDFQEKYENLAKSMLIVNDNNNEDFNYGAVLNESEEYESECSDPLINDLPEEVNNSTTDVCFSVANLNWPTSLITSQPFRPYSAFILKKTRYEQDFYKGLTFWSPNLYSTLDQTNSDPEHTIGDMWIRNGNLDELLAQDDQEWLNPATNSVPDDECTPNDITLRPSSGTDPNPLYKGWKSCVNEFTIDGSYSTIIYTKNLQTNEYYCQVFGDRRRFNRNMPMFNHGQEIYKTIVIPSVP